jgi:transposase
VPIYLCTQTVHFRKVLDGLTGIVTTAMNHIRFLGSLFLFVDRRHDRIKPSGGKQADQNAVFRSLAAEISRPK